MAKQPHPAPSERTRLKRVHERGAYDEQSIYAILDAQPICHVSYILDGSPVITPTIQWRQGNQVYWHGSSASRMIKKSAGAEVCLAMTLLDGMVMARSGFHHSVNYRSVIMFGTAQKVDDDHAVKALENMIEGLFPGRWDSLRPINEQEIKATTVLSMPIDETSAKVRQGQPVDDEEDYALPVWAGVIPVETKIGTPVADSKNLPGVAVPDHVKNFKIG